MNFSKYAKNPCKNCTIENEEANKKKGKTNFKAKGVTNYE